MNSAIHVIDSHTGGEPTRVVVDGGPQLTGVSLSERLNCFREKFDSFRSAIVNEPRGSDVLVGALLTPARDPSCAAGVIFFNNVGYLGMCGHGMIGVIQTLAHLGKIRAGVHKIETPVGVISAKLDESGSVAIQNVASYRLAKDVKVNVDGIGEIRGDIAWGGNWFFLINEHNQEIALKNVEALTDYTWRIRQALQRNKITGKDGAEIDHVEVFSQCAAADSVNFVLCPGKAYDRSPCGTGTSAKLACLYADGKIKPGQIWRQQSITGSIFEGWVDEIDGEIRPTIRGRAYITAETKLILKPDDPLCWGIRS